MKIKIKGYGQLKKVIGDNSVIELKDGAKIKELISVLGGKVESSKIAYLRDYKIEDSNVMVLVNGRNIHALNGYDTVLKESDLITFMPILIGG